jgi:hypothetical protein
MTLLTSASPAQAKVRKQSSLSAALENNLSTYALAAGAAGVALMACAQPADAKVVVTKTNIAIPINGGIVQIDINGDGQNDFGISAFAFPTQTCTLPAGFAGHGKKSPPLGCPFDDQLVVKPAQAANEVWGAGKSYYQAKFCAAEVARGSRIDRLRPFAAGTVVMYGNEGTSEGHKLCSSVGGTLPRPFLGVKFLDKSGNLHYGWIRVTHDGIRGTINGYAYETTPNVPIIAGESTPAAAASLLAPTDLTPQAAQPATLGHLALGTAGLSAWRRDEEVLATSDAV